MYKYLDFSFLVFAKLLNNRNYYVSHREVHNLVYYLFVTKISNMLRTFTLHSDHIKTRNFKQFHRKKISAGLPSASCLQATNSVLHLDENP